MRRVAALVNASDPFGKSFVEGVGAGAGNLGVAMESFAVYPMQPLEPVFKSMAGKKVDASSP